MELMRSMWRQAIGPLLDELESDREKALANLYHLDPGVRSIAISVCDWVWKCKTEPRFITACKHIAQCDQDFGARISAVEALGRALASSKDHRCSKILASIVSDPAGPSELQSEAYSALRAIQGGFTPEAERQRRSRFVRDILAGGSFTVPKHDIKKEYLALGLATEAEWNAAVEIDWEFVRQFLGDEEGTE